MMDDLAKAWLNDRWRERIEKARAEFDRNSDKRFQEFTDSGATKEAWPVWEKEAWDAVERDLKAEWREHVAELREQYARERGE